MKTCFRILSAALALVFCLTLGACHAKDEVAVTVGDTPYSSALYVYALLQADSEAKTKISDAQADDTSSDSTAEIDFYAEKIDDKDYVTWVKDRAVELLRAYTVYQQKCDELSLTPSDEDKQALDNQNSYYWNYYGYNTVYEANGVSFASFEKASSYTLLSNTYFKKLYGEGGEKAVPKADVQKTLTDDFVLVDELSASFSGQTEDEIKATRDKFNGYLEQLKAGKAFADVYKDYNGATDDQTTDGDDDSPKPQDANATVLGSENTDTPDEQFDEIKKMAVGECKLIELEDNAGLRLIVRKDISADPYYLDQMTDSILWLLKEDEYNDSIRALGEQLEVKINNFAVNRFQVKKLKYPTE